ncbi:hypothetical protein AALB39_06515 [Lachnospiraceae bacterium 54-53]
MKQQYLKPWSREYSRQFSDPRVRLASAGLLAASNHNMQPWKLVLDRADPMVFYLYADSSRTTREADPYARQMMISQGTFLEYAAVAGEEEGLYADISLFPEGEYDESKFLEDMDTKPVAKITLSQMPQKKSALYDSLFLPDTNRAAYRQIPLTPGQKTAMEAFSEESAISVRLFDQEKDIEKIGGFAMQSASTEAGIPRIMDESESIFRSNERQKNAFRYGYSIEGQGAGGFKKHLLQGLLTLFPSLNAGSSASRNFISSVRTSVENTPAYGMIITPGNSRREQVESGMLYSRLVLSGHSSGLVMQPLSQVLEEYPEMEPAYSELKKAYAPDGGTIQMLFRMGTPAKNGVRTMRRDVMNLISDH